VPEIKWRKPTKDDGLKPPYQGDETIGIADNGREYLVYQDRFGTWTGVLLHNRLGWELVSRKAEDEDEAKRECEYHYRRSLPVIDMEEGHEAGMDAG